MLLYGDELLLFVGVGLQEGVEVTHGQGTALGNAHVGNGLAIFVQRLDSCDDIVHMLLVQLAAVDSKTNHVAQLFLLLGGLQIVFHGVVAQLGGTDAVATDQFDGEALAGEGIVTALIIEELGHVNVNTVATGGQDNALDTGLVEALGQVFALLNAGLLIVEVALLVQTCSQSHDVTAGHAAVRVVAVAGDLLNLQANTDIEQQVAVLIKVGELSPETALVAEGQHATHVGVAVLLGGHGEAVAVAEHLGSDLGNGLIGIAFFVDLDEVAVLSPTSNVEHEGNVILLSDLGSLTNGLHGNSLAADGIVGDGGIDQGYILGADSLDQLLQLLNIHIALEGVLLVHAAFGNFVQQLLVIQIAGNGAHLLDVAFGGVEVTVGRNGEDLAGMTLGHDLLDHLKQHGLGSAALLNDEGVGALQLSGAAVEQTAFVLAQIQLIHHLVDVGAVGADQVDRLLPVLFAAALEDVAEGIQQNVVTLVTAVALVAQEHHGPLCVGHGGGAGVGQHVHGQHTCGESELVVVSGLQGALTLFNGHLGNITGNIGNRAGSLYVQGIFFCHFDYLQLFFRGTPVIGRNDWRTVPW